MVLLPTDMALGTAWQCLVVSWYTLCTADIVAHSGVMLHLAPHCRVNLIPNSMKVDLVVAA